MKILLISYFYHQTASGNISQRMAEELSNVGNQLKIVTSSHIGNEDDDNPQIITVANLFKPESIVYRIISKLQTLKFWYLPNIIWIVRAYYACRQVIKEWKPDVVYCRSSPEEACLVGYMLRKSCKVDVIQHFSDPIPPPSEYMIYCRKRNILGRLMKKVIESASIVSYGNSRMKDYVYRELDILQQPRSFISPDPCSKIEFVGAPKREQALVRLCYLGNIYGGRNPQPLFDAVHKLNESGIQIKLSIYSPANKLYPNNELVSFEGYTGDVVSAMCDSDILVDLDGDDEVPVFISSKLKDYLLIGRPILSITPENSPSEELLSNLSSVISVRNNADDIRKAVHKIISTPYEQFNYSDRDNLISSFRPHKVAADLIDNIIFLLRR